MKRTAEIVLTVIGIVLNVIMIGIGALINFAFNDVTLRNEMEDELMKDPTLSNADVDINMIMDFLGGVGWGFIIIVTISTILAIIAAVVVRGNRKPKLAGGLLIGSSLLLGIGTILIGWLPALLFLIAGILCFARRPKEPVDHSMY
ncbi:DUF4064 domain-containing protein [Peribacillus tepidiphilus]|uniref:DUF4064 domain-containing protein n=1 Tax=Peribacillus tepidiphilus TaxID=2652445 RepID=UPI001292274A|nr:DUF4064 domain-containing protein [Peribacillus tepidiphilus]